MNFGTKGCEYNCGDSCTKECLRDNATKIQEVGNYYGSLHVVKRDGKHYMKVFSEVYEKDWKEIKKELYDMLVELNG